LWKALRDAGSPFGIIPYGLESLELLRVEKGFLSSGHEINGRTTPDDLGLRKMLKKKPGYLGAAGLTRPALRADGRHQLVGLIARDGELSEGAQLVPSESAKPQVPEGYVTSAAYSVSLQSHIALALLANGRARHGEMLVAADPVRSRAGIVRIVPPMFYDPEGMALHG
jgi:sarcosine oxidase subunit alpha